MSEIKTKSIQAIEKRMENINTDSMRYKALESVKYFKTSWIDLGQILYTVWKDKLYKDWGYSEFDTYATKEIGIKKQTALKLLKSYYFLEKEEPGYLKKDYSEKKNAASLPTFESIDVLRLASKNKNINKDDYNSIKAKVLQNGKDAREIKKDLTNIIREREEIEPEEAWKKKRIALLKRLIGTLRSVRNEIKAGKTLPAELLKDTDNLIEKLEREIP